MVSGENKAVVQRFFQEAINKRNVAVIDELFASNYAHHDAAAPAELQQSRDGYKQLIVGFLAAFPDLTMKVEDWVVEGDKVVALWSWRATHTGPLGPIPPTRKKVSGMGIDIRRVTNGKIVEGWVGYDMMNMMQQLGLVPSAGPGR
ncbi:MAG: ester cyclase [Armatimonadota bacterium]